jgi:4-oxalocrotonate tautomerase family enzyme
VKAVTDAICDTLKISPAGVRIILRDMPRENYAVGGELWYDHPEPFKDHIDNE